MHVWSHKSRRLVAPRPVDGPLQEILAQPLADEFRDESELNDLDLVFFATIEFGEAAGNAVDMQHVDFIFRIVNDGRQRVITQSLATSPIPGCTDRVVKEAVIGDRRMHGPNHGQAGAEGAQRFADGQTSAGTSFYIPSCVPFTGFRLGRRISGGKSEQLSLRLFRRWPVATSAIRDDRTMATADLLQVRSPSKPCRPISCEARW